ncbi:iron chelate uptake ABC transporter family permease subunit [Botrimarina mediterranea]|uniref:Manganese transport system membrane protein MntB n=1 Tax=Botrimarina mediterranea TaxID=2528022 RepID=A0A518K8W7_9BACT|nr:iron chelate uptake ABC transporter family permease subunit [Botrimarina mediterranea]QDV74223.1 Manganese transport system membrane protein MntB [Botrimarina mediterranea]QDV78854.1 Manganese transport system membrane protein MntB [Planctomycetes bacterium K2D]
MSGAIALLWPTLLAWADVLLLRDYNTRVVVLGATLLGVGAGVVGSFTLLRKRALIGDALSHATLPGIATAFLVGSSLWGDGKSLPILLLGGAISGVLGVGAILMVRRFTRLSEDAALGIVLSVFFGAGVALLGVTQQVGGNAAGLESFIYGKTASMLSSDAWLIAGASAACVLVSLLLFKELALLCFDAGFAASRGYPVGWLDAALMAMVVVITIVGLQAVGLILMIALLVIPPAAARFWTEDLRTMTRIAALLGGLSSFVGAILSASYPKLPSGATIVLVAAAAFVLSALFGMKRGVVLRWLRRRWFLRGIEMEHLLRSVYEVAEHREDDAAPRDRLLALRSWSQPQLRHVIGRAARQGLVRLDSQDAVRLTARGAVEAKRLTRQHRLWELYLITHAEVAPGKVDRGADAIEHVLDPETIHELELLLHDSSAVAPPASPHVIRGTTE